MALAVALPPQWPIIRTYFAITVILSVLGWTGMARVVRGKFLALRNEDFVVAAHRPTPDLADPVQTSAAIVHSHLIATATLSIPEMVLAETAPELPGNRPAGARHQLGRHAAESQNIQSVAVTPWLLLPVSA